MHKEILISAALAALLMADGAMGGETTRIPGHVPVLPDRVSEETTGNAKNEAFPAEFQVQTVIPEASTAVTMSNSDINRITCREEIRDVVFSKEKGLSVKTVGRDAFVKFLITRKDEKETYSSTPTEIFVVCGENVYNLIALPKRVPSQTVRLSPGNEKIRDNARRYGSLPYEKKILSLIRNVYTNEITDGFSSSLMNRRLQVLRDLDVTLVRTHRVEGEGLLIKEYAVESKKAGEEQRVTEKDFLRPAIAARPVAISLDTHRLKHGDRARLIVVEQSGLSGEGGTDVFNGQN